MILEVALNDQLLNIAKVALQQSEKRTYQVDLCQMDIRNVVEKSAKTSQKYSTPKSLKDLAFL